MIKSEQIMSEIKAFSNEELAKHHLKFFKTGKGEYGEGDLFYGMTVPQVKGVANKYFKEISLKETEKILQNNYHECRTVALVMLILKYQKASQQEKEEIYNLYLNNVNYINNWDLVDVSAYKIVGDFLFQKDVKPLWKLAKSGHLWSERISVISTLYFIKKGKFTPTVELSKHFLAHKHDLMHKATGWMLREVGKKDVSTLHEFLKEFHKVMPRTMLRYAIEKLSKDEKTFYMKR